MNIHQVCDVINPTGFEAFELDVIKGRLEFLVAYDVA